MFGKVVQEKASFGKQGDASVTRDGLVELTGLQSSEATKSQLWSRGNKRRMLLLRSLPSSLLPLSLSARVRRQRSLTVAHGTVVAAASTVPQLASSSLW